MSKSDRLVVNIAFVNKYIDLVRAMAFRHAPHPDLIDDIVQQVFVEVLEGCDSIDEVSSVNYWLHAVTQKIAKRFWRERMKSMPDTLQKVFENVRKSVEHEPLADVESDNIMVLRKCIERLAPKSREVVKLRYTDDLSPPEIAKLLKIRTASVSQMLYRIRQTLQACVGELTFQKEEA